LVVALTFVIGMFSANAVTVTTDANNKVTNTDTLTINGVQSTDSFSAYKIVDVIYDATTNTVSYAFTTDFAPYAATKNVTVNDYMSLTSGSLTSGSTQTNSTLDTLVSGYVSYIKTNNKTGTAMTVSGTNATATLPAGAYLVLPTQTDRVYAVMVGNILLEAGSNNTWDLTADTIVAKVSDPSVTKIVKGKTNNESYKIGDNITFEVTTTVPTYPTNATNTQLELTDTLSSGLDFVSTAANVVVYDGATALTNNEGHLKNGINEPIGTVTLSGRNLVIELNADMLANTTIKVEYIAKLNNNAVLGSAGNTNTATLEYANDPYGTGTDTKSSTTTIKTYAIRVNKKDNSNNPLGSVEFNVCSDSACNNVVGTITTNAQGVGEYKGLASGTYYLKETRVPAGYKIKTDVISVTIDTTKDYTDVNVTNERLLLSLPGTGGKGIYIYIGVGVAIIAAAVIGIVVVNKKKDE